MRRLLPITSLRLCALLFAAASARASAQDGGVTLEALQERVAELERAQAAPFKPVLSKGPFQLTLGGYGDLQFSYSDFGTNQNRVGGAQRDSRVVFDDARFVLKLEGVLPFGIKFESEIEFEHGGTSVAQELDYEEFGEYEVEVEKGGEVLLEEFYLRKSFFDDRFFLGGGRLYVAVGLLPDKHMPDDYLGTVRAESELTVLPGVWDELGFQAELRLPWLRLRAQLVSGLDSTAFSSQRWIGSGQQLRFDLVRASDPAGVLRADFTLRPDFVVGLSGYAGGTSRNRPKPDLVAECPDGDPEVVAPCGYIEATVFIGEAHTNFRWGPLRGQGLVLLGSLHNAEAVSRRNERLSNALQVLRSPVADHALAVWGELGLDVGPWLGLAPADHRLTPFVRFDHYDTMFAVRDGLFDNPRFERNLLTAGVSYVFFNTVVLKLDATRRWFGSSAFRPEDTVRLSAGFTY